MEPDDIDRSIVDALEHPGDGDKLSAIIRLGQDAYERIVSRMYPCSGVTHPQDGDDRMSDLIVRIARKDASIITNNIDHKESLARSRVVGAAMATGMEEFTDVIIDRLADRSIYVLDKAVWAVERNHYLQTQRAAELLRSLMKKKIVDRLYIPASSVAELAGRIESQPPNKRMESNG